MSQSIGKLSIDVMLFATSWSFSKSQKKPSKKSLNSNHHCSGIGLWQMNYESIYSRAEKSLAIGWWDDLVRDEVRIVSMEYYYWRNFGRDWRRIWQRCNLMEAKAFLIRKYVWVQDRKFDYLNIKYDGEFTDRRTCEDLFWFDFVLNWESSKKKENLITIGPYTSIDLIPMQWAASENWKQV